MVRILGDIIISKAGQATFDAIEGIRLVTAKFNRDYEIAAAIPLDRLLNVIDYDQAFSHGMRPSYFKRPLKIAEHLAIHHQI